MITKTKVAKSKIVERTRIDGMDLVRVETDSGEWGADYEWAICDRPTDRRHKSEMVIFLGEYAKEWNSICCDEETDPLLLMSAIQNGQDTCIEISVTKLFASDSFEFDYLACKFALSTLEMMLDQAD